MAAPKHPQREISIHALREEGDPFVTGRSTVLMLFLSTPSARRATDLLSKTVLIRVISIHALREEGDASAGGRCRSPSYFYPRPPRGGRLHRSGWNNHSGRFLSTPSARRATFLLQRLDHFIKISIHALREEGDQALPHHLFQPRISIHALREEGDSSPHPRQLIFNNFYPRPPRGGRRCAAHQMPVL